MTARQVHDAIAEVLDGFPGVDMPTKIAALELVKWGLCYECKKLPTNAPRASRVERDGGGEGVDRKKIERAAKAKGARVFWQKGGGAGLSMDGGETWENFPGSELYKLYSKLDVA